MRITRIKLSGFKSFVDPTNLTLPGNLTGVVGPNGCGKSNIIDALIWVMGETSAKHLRGDSMADVIFNGSNTRKPVGQATVEIVFDNADGTIGGQYASFAEISIKRTVSRDGISNYFLNGARCRRKDITSVFLGTGIGARGYSVIEQGMISRVIEAKPEELRGFLEEAAGISKYKERRRETENRMRHTHENIERLDDIRDELEKQLAHLQRQARAAERYQTLKADERRTEARLLAVRWRTLETDRERGRHLAEQRANELEEKVAELREIEARQTGYREAQSEATERFNAVQSTFYARSADISRLEQAIRHDEEREQGLTEDLETARARLAELATELERDGATLATVRGELAEIEPRFGSRREEESAALEAVRAAEARMEQWQQDWDAFNAVHTELAQREHAAQIRLEHLADDLSDVDTRTRHLNELVSRTETTDLAARVSRLRAELGQADERRTTLTGERSAVRASLTQNRGAAQTLGAALHERQSELEELRGRLASLRALQEAAYGGDQDVVDEWLRARGVTEAGRLAEYLDIEPGWERAVEAALGIPLGSVCGENLTERLSRADRGGLDTRSVTVVDARATPVPNSAPRGSLAARVTSRVDLAPLLDGVHTADSPEAARALRERLPAGEVVALADGTLLGSNWMTLPGDGQAEEGILARERQIAELDARVALRDDETGNLRAQLAGAQARLQETEAREHALAAELETLDRDMTSQRETLNGLEAELQRREARARDVAEELERLGRQSQESRELIAGLESERTLAARELADHAERRDALTAARTELQRALDASRTGWREARDGSHELELRLENLKSRREALDAAIARNRSACETLEAQAATLASSIDGARAPREQMAQELEHALAQKLEAETALNAARGELSGLDHDFQQAASARAEAEQGITERQQRLEQARLDQRALEVRQQELLSRFENTGEDFDTIRGELGDEDTEGSVTEALEKLGNRIARLGPINLAAIDEFTQLSERKEYLDRQHADLTQALDTLVEAIRKIDKETRTRFKETYDKVNNGLQTMFPVLFGGGHAYLELTGDDLLETGVTVMARPPGKRNSTIHLLSGGEKALTALAFVFSIFELNPAPFCLLDEVDAPLDDANVVRLTEMLKTMAGTVQFLFVTHNKITMEIAEQLIGVTMQEAGVSRLVSVNMEEAVELAATA